MTRIYFIQKWILVFLLLSSGLLFNPFVNTDVFEFPKVIALIGTTGLLSIINIIDLYLHGLPKINWRSINKELFCLALLLFTQIISYIFSTDSSVSLMGGVQRYQGFLTNIHYILLSLNTLYFFTKYPPTKTATLFKWLITTLIVTSLLAVLPYIFPMTFPFYFFTPAFFYNRVFGTLGNPNYLAVFIITILPFLIFSKNFKKIFLYTSLTIVIVTLFLTGSRSAWAASLFGFLIMGIILAVKKKHYKIITITCLIIAIAIAGISIKKYLAPIIPQFERLSLDTNKSTSIQTRIHLWKAGLKMSLKRPLTGYGQDMIQENIEHYLPEYLKSNDEFFIDRTHSEFIDIFATNGIFAIIAYFGLLIFIIKKNAKIIFKNVHNNHNLTSAFTALITLIIFHGVNFSITSSNILLYFLVGYLLAQNISLYSPMTKSK